MNKRQGSIGRESPGGGSTSAATDFTFLTRCTFRYDPFFWYRHCVRQWLSKSYSTMCDPLGGGGGE
jgi:hypothetical protein